MHTSVVQFKENQELCTVLADSHPHVYIVRHCTFTHGGMQRSGIFTFCLSKRLSVYFVQQAVTVVVKQARHQ